MVACKHDYGSGGGFSKSFGTQLVEYFKEKYSRFSTDQNLKILDILLHTETLVSNVPLLFFNSLEHVSSIGNLLAAEPILLYLYGSNPNLIPDSLHEKIKQLSQQENNSMTVNQFLLNVLSRQGDSSNRPALESNLIQMINRLHEEKDEIYFSLLLQNLSYIIGFYSSHKLTYRKFEPEFLSMIDLAATYYSSSASEFNFEETMELLEVV